MSALVISCPRSMSSWYAWKKSYHVRFPFGISTTRKDRTFETTWKQILVFMICTTGESSENFHERKKKWCIGLNISKMVGLVWQILVSYYIRVDYKKTERALANLKKRHNFGKGEFQGGIDPWPPAWEATTLTIRPPGRYATKRWAKYCWMGFIWMEIKKR